MWRVTSTNLPDLEQRSIQVSEVVIPQIADREPQVLLGGRAEDLRRGALVLGLFGPEQDAPPPSPIFGMPQSQPDEDTLAFESNSGEIVYDCFVWRLNRLTCQLCRHVEPWAGLGKDYRGEGVTQYVRGQGPGAWFQVGTAETGSPTPAS